MTNKEISKIFSFTGKLMDLHNENPFKAKSYTSAAFRIGKLPQPLAKLTPEELIGINGIGNSLAGNIAELASTGSFKELDRLVGLTPVGVLDILRIKGLGAKKVRVLWKDLEVESIGELLYACNENRLVELKGFGKKTQDQVKSNIEYMLANLGKFHFATAEAYASDLLEEIKEWNIAEVISITGKMRRKCEVVEWVDILLASKNTTDEIKNLIEQNSGVEVVVHEGYLEMSPESGIPVRFYSCEPEEFHYRLFMTTGSEKFVNTIKLDGLELAGSEEEIFGSCDLPYLIPERREDDLEIAMVKEPNELIELQHIKGIVHNHSTYSDGIHTLREMAEYCKSMGMEYFGIADHSQTAVYAGGLKPDDVIRQHEEIDRLNQELTPFKILKGIESDILHDGSLDYPDEILSTFDYVVASVHSGLKMTMEKANTRLIRAIENPYTTVLGHPTGRLLLSREGYPIDHKKIIDACAANNVVLELNANPYRLDIDWRWIDYAMEKEVLISINPDAHSKEGLHDIHYGICVARKGGLIKEMTFNAFSLKEMELYLKDQ